MFAILGKLPLIKMKGVSKMATILCDHCGSRRQLDYQRATWVSSEGPDIIYGVLTCPKCEQKTIFGMTDDAISFYPTKAAWRFTC